MSLQDTLDHYDPMHAAIDDDAEAAGLRATEELRQAFRDLGVGDFSRLPFRMLARLYRESLRARHDVLAREVEATLADRMGRHRVYAVAHLDSVYLLLDVAGRKSVQVLPLTSAPDLDRRAKVFTGGGAS